MRKRASRDVTKFGRALDRLFSQLPGTLHLAQVPGRSYEICSCEDFSCRGRKGIVTARRGRGDFTGAGPELPLDLQEFALVATRCAETTAGVARLPWRIRLPRPPAEGLGRPLRSAMFAPREASHPLRKVGRELFSGVFRPTGQSRGRGQKRPSFHPPRSPSTTSPLGR